MICHSKKENKMKIIGTNEYNVLKQADRELANEVFRKKILKSLINLELSGSDKVKIQVFKESENTFQVLEIPRVS